MSSPLLPSSSAPSAAAASVSVTTAPACAAERGLSAAAASAAMPSASPLGPTGSVRSTSLPFSNASAVYGSAFGGLGKNSGARPKAFSAITISMPCNGGRWRVLALHSGGLFRWIAV